MAKVDKPTFWEDHYAHGRMPWDLGQPAREGLETFGVFVRK